MILWEENDHNKNMDPLDVDKWSREDITTSKGRGVTYC